MWVRIESRTPGHPKLAGLSHAARWLWIAGLCYCGEYLTDGAIKRETAATLMDGYRQAHAVELVAAGLWDLTPDGYRVHDYLDFQPSAAAELGRRQRDIERKARARDAKRQLRGVS